MKRKLLAVIAHPDDESFGFGGTIAKYAREGVEIHVFCATRGEEGKTTIQKSKLGKVRERELFASSKILGVSQVEFMDYHDGTLCNKLYQEIAAKIENKIKTFAPQVVITFDKTGISGHIDHITISLATTFVCQKLTDVLKLYYYGRLKNFTDKVKNYFVYFPPGFTKKEVDVVIDTTKVYDKRVAAMHKHKSQLHDVDRILKMEKGMKKAEHFVEVFKKKKTKVRFDLF